MSKNDKHKENLALATRIVDELCTVVPETVPVAVEEGEDPKEEKIFTARIIQIAGYTRALSAYTEKAARQELIDFITDELDSERLVLSDTWAEDNGIKL